MWTRLYACQCKFSIHAALNRFKMREPCGVRQRVQFSLYSTYIFHFSLVLANFLTFFQLNNIVFTLLITKRHRLNRNRPSLLTIERTVTNRNLDRARDYFIILCKYWSLCLVNRVIDIGVVVRLYAGFDENTFPVLNFDTFPVRVSLTTTNTLLPDIIERKIIVLRTHCEILFKLFKLCCNVFV